MGDEYARAVSRVVAGQLTENAGYEAAQDSAVEILSELLMRYISEVAAGAHSYAEIASRTEANACDTLLALDDMGTSVEELQAYLDSVGSVSSRTGGQVRGT